MANAPTTQPAPHKESVVTTNDEEEGTMYETGRAVVQVRAVVAVVNAILECLPPDARAVALSRAQQSLDGDPGGLKILENGLRITRDPNSPAKR